MEKNLNLLCNECCSGTGYCLKNETFSVEVDGDDSHIINIKVPAYGYGTSFVGYEDCFLIVNSNERIVHWIGYGYKGVSDDSFSLDDDCNRNIAIFDGRFYSEDETGTRSESLNRSLLLLKPFGISFDLVDGDYFLRLNYDPEMLKPTPFSPSKFKVVEKKLLNLVDVHPDGDGNPIHDSSSLFIDANSSLEEQISAFIQYYSVPLDRIKILYLPDGFFDKDDDYCDKKFMKYSFDKLCFDSDAEDEELYPLMYAFIVLDNELFIFSYNNEFSIYNSLEYDDYCSYFRFEEVTTSVYVKDE